MLELGRWLVILVPPVIRDRKGLTKRTRILGAYLQSILMIASLELTLEGWVLVALLRQNLPLIPLPAFGLGCLQDFPSQLPKHGVHVFAPQIGQIFVLPPASTL